jgi:hypothetical protein
MMSNEIEDSYNRYLIYTILGVNNGFDAIKGYLDNCLVEFHGKYEHFTNPWFSYGLRAIVRNQCKDIFTPEVLMNDTVLSGAVQIMMAQN